MNIRIHILFLCGAFSSLPAQATDLSLRLLPTLKQSNASSPFAHDDYALLRAEATLHWRQSGWTFNGALSGEVDDRRNRDADAHVNELFYETSLGDWELSVGQKRLGWGMGFGFRPLDTIQREPRRSVQSLLLDGIPSVIVEKFSGDSSLSLIYAARTQWRDWQREGSAHSGTLRYYRFVGDWEFMALGGWEEQRGTTLGGGFSLVQGDSWKFHGELAWREQYDTWRSHLLDNEDLVYPGNPMYQAQDDNAWQAVLGAQWSHAEGAGVLLEYWYDGSAWRGNDWADLLALSERQQAALIIPKLSNTPLSANLAAAEQAYLHSNLLQHNVLLRLSHDNGERTFALEYLITPQDGGGMVTLSLEDGSLDRQKIRLGARLYTGPNDSAYGALSESLVISATWEMGWKL